MGHQQFMFEFPAIFVNQVSIGLTYLVFTRQIVAQLAKALLLQSGDSGFESHQNLNLLQIFLQNHNKMAGISNIIINW